LKSPNGKSRLKGSVASLQTTLDNSPYLVWLKDSDGHYITINKALSDYIGLKDVKDVINKTDFDLWPKDLAEKYRIDDAEIMASRQKQHIEEQIFDGTKLHWIETFKTPIIDETGKVLGTTGFSRDITERKGNEAIIHSLAYYDALTKLPNRRLLKDRLCQALDTSKRSGQYAALMFIDLDNFKPLNDTYGHDVGDLLLVEVASRITNCVRKNDTVARFGGDEYVVILSELSNDLIKSTELANNIAEKIRTIIAKPYLLPVQHELKADAIVEHNCTSSIGVVLFIDHEVAEEDILKWADHAMYQAKNDGRNLIRFYKYEILAL
jgi:diguanylate cyclase (GGDEF)-like protein/PAS domain S-box-containing protein